MPFLPGLNSQGSWHKGLNILAAVYYADDHVRDRYLDSHGYKIRELDNIASGSPVERSGALKISQERAAEIIQSEEELHAASEGKVTTPSKVQFSDEVRVKPIKSILSDKEAIGKTWWKGWEELTPARDSDSKKAGAEVKSENEETLDKRLKHIGGPRGSHRHELEAAETLKASQRAARTRQNTHTAHGNSRNR